MSSSAELSAANIVCQLQRIDLIGRLSHPALTSQLAQWLQEFDDVDRSLSATATGGIGWFADAY
jgi:hypothetical protein